MSLKANKVLIVDDEQFFLDLLVNILDDSDYEPVAIDNAADALNIINKTPEDFCLILSDIIMPNMDGYQFCQTIKENKKLVNIPFVFLSSLSSLEDKIKGFDLGVDDYVSKPIIPEELKLIISNILKNKRELFQVNTQLAEANKIAANAINYASDLGRVVAFYEEAMASDSFAELAEKLFDLTRSYQLKSTIYIDNDHNPITFSDNKYTPPLEIKLFQQVKTQTRFFDFGKRTVVNYPNHSLLIKNMPIENEEKYGIIKDILGAVCNALSAKIALLSHQLSRETQKLTMLQIIHDAINDIETSSKKLQDDNILLVENLYDDIDKIINSQISLEEMETKISGLTQEYVENSNTNFHKGLQVFEILQNMKAKVELCMKTDLEPKSAAQKAPEEFDDELF